MRNIQIRPFKSDTYHNILPFYSGKYLTEMEGQSGSGRVSMMMSMSSWISAHFNAFS